MLAIRRHALHPAAVSVQLSNAKGRLLSADQRACHSIPRDVQTATWETRRITRTPRRRWGNRDPPSMWIDCTPHSAAALLHAVGWFLVISAWAPRWRHWHYTASGDSKSISWCVTSIARPRAGANCDGFTSPRSNQQQRRLPSFFLLRLQRQLLSFYTPCLATCLCNSCGRLLCWPGSEFRARYLRGGGGVPLSCCRLPCACA